MSESVTRLLKLISGEGVQALAEYSLILAFIAVVCVIALTALGLATSGGFSAVTGSF